MYEQLFKQTCDTLLQRAVIVRDLCTMVFKVIFMTLVIFFYTPYFRVEKYKKPDNKIWSFLIGVQILRHFLRNVYGHCYLSCTCTPGNSEPGLVLRTGNFDTKVEPR